MAFLFGGLRSLDANLRGRGRRLTVYSRAWRALPLPNRSDLKSAPEHLTPPLADLFGLPIPDQPALPVNVPLPPGQAEALRRLAVFIEGESASICRYARGRDRLALAGTSELSPYLRFGMVFLYHFPDVLEREFREDLRAIPWANDPTDFAA